jgi:DNA-binding transcriptional ArsR family regulator
VAQLLRLTAQRCEAECLDPATVRPVIDRTLAPDAVQATAAWFGLLADPTRLRILQVLSLAPELCAHDIALVLDISVSALSHQLRLLRERGLVTRRKAGRIAWFSLADDHVRHVLTDAVAHAATEVRPAAAAVAGPPVARSHHHLDRHRRSRLADPGGEAF